MPVRLPGRVALVRHLSCIALPALLAACGGDSTAPPSGGGDVLAAVIVSPDSVSLSPGETMRLTIALRDETGAILPSRQLAWTTSAADVATVAGDGTVTGVGPGTTFVRAAAGAISGTAKIIVALPDGPVPPPAPGPVTAITISGVVPDSMLQGQTVQLTAVARDSRGTVVPGAPVQWIGNTVTAVSATGLVTALRAGRVAVTAKAAEVVSPELIFLVIDTVATDSIVPAALTMAVGGSIQLIDRLRNDHGAILDVALIGGGRTVVWSSSSPSASAISTAPNWAQVTLGPAPADVTITGTTVLENKSASAHIVTRTYQFTDLGVGLEHACGLSAAGEPACWGTNARLQLGVPNVDGIAAPVSPTSTMTFQTIAAGASQVCGLTAAGQAWCWGGDWGSAGGNDQPYLNPNPVPGGYTFTTLSVFAEQSCGLTAGGVAVCWGRQAQMNNVPAPTAVRSPVAFAAIAAGQDHACGLSTAGAAWCWGTNTYGEIGDGTKQNTRDDPVLVSGGLTFTSIAAGYGRTCALTAAGQAWCWGGGEVGDGTIFERLVPTLVQAPGVQFTRLSVGTAHQCGLTTTGSVYCWGYNVDGQSSSDEAPETLLPSAIALPGAATAIGTGFKLSCAATTNGIYCWGDNRKGQLGAGAMGVGLVNTRGRGPVRVAGQ